ncbi:ABC transporter ATP-binding protein [Aquimarina sp. I32.4]|uniref:ABC transporter ATP-binding protein n=1 Tax=Aquimarina sp. I32.4 TaxID=2053903 RepID=UPI000CDEF159|nr:ABC transporter ATP-binding protein [Aquimarina sp. I32.4]
MIKATNIHKNYGDLHVLKGVDLHIKKGEIVSIVGASGAGKTTLLQILGTLDNPNNDKNDSSLTINESDIFELQKEESKIHKLKSSSLIIPFFRVVYLGFVIFCVFLFPDMVDTYLRNAIKISLIIVPLLIFGISRLFLKKKKKGVNLSSFRNTNLGFIFQFHQLLPEFTALENVCIPAFIKKTPKDKAEKRAKELLDFLGLSHRYNHKPNELSGGEQQRVAVARALINNPKVIFADEPSGNLDSEAAENLHQLFFKLRDQFGQTFVIVTHNRELADMADRKLVMVDGKIVTKLSEK